MPGIFTSTGSDLRLSDITIDLNTGEVGPMAVDLRMDTWNHWLLVTRQMRDQANAATAKVLTAHQQGDDVALSEALEEEFRHSMMGISAAAFTFDAFYASVKSRYRPHPSEAEWKKNRLARHKQIAETFRWVWNIKPPEARIIRDSLRQLFKFRDSAVHPPIDFREPILREDIDRGVEWRFVHFRAENARTAFRMASDIPEALIRATGKAPPELREWLNACRPLFATAAGYEVRETR